MRPWSPIDRRSILLAGVLLAVALQAAAGSAASTGTAPGHPGEVAQLEATLAAEPDRLDLRWQLLRALYYRADFGSESVAEEAAGYAQGREVSEEGRRRLTRRFGTLPDRMPPGGAAPWVERTGLAASDVARFYFWSSVHWGGWSQSAGLLQAVRQGAAERLHAYTRVALELEPGYERGGPHRLMSRLHGTLPRVPFLSGWVDRDEALRQAERALEVAPEDPGNRFLYAITLLDHVPQRSREARAILLEVSALEPRPGLEHEDAAVRDASRTRLAEERGRRSRDGR